eukprot:203195_1
MYTSKQQASVDAITPITPFKPSTRLLSPRKNDNGLSTRCLLTYALIHMAISITLIVLYVEAFMQDFIHATLLCYQEHNGITSPCNEQNQQLTTVYTTSIFNIVTNSWNRKNYHISVILLFLSFIFPFIHIINNLFMAFKQNTSIKVNTNQSLCSGIRAVVPIIFVCLNKLPLLYVFGCILFINGLHQSTSTPNTPSGTIYQTITIETAIGVVFLMFAIIIASIWTVYIQYGLNKHNLFGHQRYLNYNYNIMQYVSVWLLIILGGIGILLIYFININFIAMEYNNNWNQYDITFDNKHRKYNFISIINDMKNKGLTAFYYLYVVVCPTVCYIGYIILFIKLKYYHSEIKKVILMLLFYFFLCCNGLDMLIITTISFKYLLPSIWGNIIDNVYNDFCNEYNSFCDNLTVEIVLENGLLIGCVFVIIFILIFCFMNDFKCSEIISSRYMHSRTDTWEYKHTRSSIRNSRNSVNDGDTTESGGVGLSRLYLPHLLSTASSGH